MRPPVPWQLSLFSEPFKHSAFSLPSSRGAPVPSFSRSHGRDNPFTLPFLTHPSSPTFRSFFARLLFTRRAPTFPPASFLGPFIHLGPASPSPQVTPSHAAPKGSPAPFPQVCKPDGQFDDFLISYCHHTSPPNARFSYRFPPGFPHMIFPRLPFFFISFPTSPTSGLLIDPSSILPDRNEHGSSESRLFFTPSFNFRRPLSLLVFSSSTGAGPPRSRITLF